MADPIKEEGTKFETELAKFDPQVAELQKIAKVASEITITDFSDKGQIALVREKRIELKGMRVNITKTGKALRDDANAFNAAVLKKEKEMVGLIEPEEKRLQDLEDEAERLAEIEKRKKDLPLRKARLSEIGDGIEIEDQGILEMDDTQFDSYINQRVANWNIKEKERLAKEAQEAEEKRAAEAKAEAERKEAEEKERKEKQEKEDAERKAKQDAEDAERKAKQEAEDKERAEAQAKLDAEAKRIEDEKRDLEHKKEVEAAAKAAEEKAKKDAEDAAKAKAEAEEKEKAEAAAKAKAEAQALAKKKEYQDFLEKHGYSEKTKAEFHLEEDESKVVIYKKIGTYTK